LNKNKKINKLILASSSKNRENLLKKMKIPFEVFTPEIDEKSLLNEKPQQLVKRLSYEKAIVAKRKYKKYSIIAADTIVFARKKILDKTTDINQAKLNLKILSGRRHRVFTGLTFIKDDNRFYQYVCKSIIKFRVLSENDIDKYLQLNEWKNCAGSYSIQGFAESFIEMISGSYSNVIGLPMHITFKILKNNKFI